MKAQFSSTPKILASSNLTYWLVGICLVTVVSIGFTMLSIKEVREQKNK